MTVSFTDALSRIDQIEQQVESLEGGFASAGGIAGTTAATDASSSNATGSTSSTGFSGALAQAQASDPAATAASAETDAATAADPTLSTDTTTAADPSFAAGATTGSFPTVAGSALGAPTASLTLPTVTGPAVSAVSGPTGGVAVAPPYTTATGVTPPYTTSASDTTPYTTTGSVALPTGAGTMLTSSQQQFASTLSADTGLNPGVVSAWLLSEESGGAAQSRQAAGNNDWLNIGYTGSGTFGADDWIWSDRQCRQRDRAVAAGPRLDSRLRDGQQRHPIDFDDRRPDARDSDRVAAELRLVWQRLSEPARDLFERRQRLASGPGLNSAWLTLDEYSN